MWFETLKITKKRFQKKDNTQLKIFIIYLFIWFLSLLICVTFVIYFKYIKSLPNITKLEQLDIKEASTIYDKNGWELYTLFWEEKRTYVNYDKISKNMLNAIVSWEDKTFYENPWIDFKWLLRALLNYVSWRSDKIEWTSTITQQLIKTVFLSNERKLERKIKEAYLSYEITKNYSKEKIIELYLNQISFWSNSFWVEQASRTFFAKSAKDLDILQSAILASIPKWPTYYSPYNHFDRLVWNLYIYQNNDDKIKNNLIKQDEIKSHSWMINLYKKFILDLKWTRMGENWILLCSLDNKFFKKNLSIDKDWCSLMEYSDLLSFLNNIKITNFDTSIEYQTWRKDFILWRMLEDNKITFEDYKTALLNSIWFKFNEYVENIKYPHFVFYIKDYLISKYWEEILEEWWLKIYTTIDPKLQAKAMEIVKKQVSDNYKKFDANNGALISMDNKTWDIVAYVWWADYFNKDIDWNVNILSSKRQPWSTFKPFVYALAIDKNPIWPHTPIFDLKTTFANWWAPNNYNWKFEWKMNIMTALNHSRNIPAIKAYFMAWEQKQIIEYLKTAWVKSLNNNFYYWAPLAIWTWEMTPFELLWAYSVFANLWIKIDINPISLILDSKWNVIEEKKKTAWVRVLDEKTAYIMNYILSADYSRPSEYWNKNLTLNWRKSCAKTWTSNKEFKVNWKKQILPWDLWTAWYTPQYTTVVWVWNTNWKAIAWNWDWLNWAAPMWKNFMELAHEKKEKLDWKKPSNLNYVSVSKISWLLAPEGFNQNFVVQSLFKNIPKKYDQSLKQIEVDMMCNWKVSENTPKSAIKTWYLVNFTDIDPNNKAWNQAVKEWANQYWNKEFEWIWNIITTYNDEECKRDENQLNNSNIKVLSNIKENDIFIVWKNKFWMAYTSVNPLKKIQIFIWNNLIQEMTDIETFKTWTYKWDIVIPSSWDYNWDYKITIKVFDSVFNAWEENHNIKIFSSDTFWPIINIVNPEKDNISIYDNQFFNLRFNIEDNSWLKSTNLYLDNNPLELWINWNDIVREINKDNSISVWTHSLKIESVDNFFNKTEKIINFEIMKR